MQGTLSRNGTLRGPSSYYRGQNYWNRVWGPIITVIIIRNPHNSIGNSTGPNGTKIQDLGFGLLCVWVQFFTTALGFRV